MCKGILFGMDGSQMPEQALKPAGHISLRIQAEPVILRVMVPLAKSYRGESVSVSVIESAENEIRSIALEYLQDLKAKAEMRGTRGETDATRWLLGSVTDHVVRGAKVSVAVVPAKRKAD